MYALPHELLKEKLKILKNLRFNCKRILVLILLSRNENLTIGLENSNKSPTGLSIETHILLDCMDLCKKKKKMGRETLGKIP